MANSTSTRQDGATLPEDVEGWIETVLERIDNEGFYVVEGPDEIKYFADVKRQMPSAWKRLRREVRKHCKGNPELPNVEDVDDWKADVSAKAAESEAADAVDGSSLVFNVADAVEISRQLERDIQGNGHELVFDYGKFHQYNPDSGLWEIVSRERLSRQLQEYSGAMDTSGAEPKPLKVSDTKKSGAIEMFRDRIYRAAKDEDERGFFDNAPRGLMFDNTFLRVDVENETIEPETPDPFEHRARIGAGIPFDPHADAPLFDRYLASTFDGDADPEGKRKLVLEFCGACLLGIAPTFERALVLYDATDRSAGANGKTVLIKLLTEAFARSATSNVKPQQFDEKFASAELAGSRINFATEMPENDILASDMLKGVITGDPMQAQRKYEHPFSFRPKAGHIFAANDFPRVVATDDAFWRRWLVLPFSNRFTPEGDPGRDRIPDLDEKIVQNEMPGVLARMVDGAQRLLEQGDYTVPASAQAAKREWRRESNPIAQFLIDETKNYNEAGPTYDNEPGWWKDSSRYETAGDLYDAYQAWAKATGHSPVSKTKFGRRVGKLLDRKRTSESRRYRIRLVPHSNRVAKPKFEPNM